MSAKLWRPQEKGGRWTIIELGEDSKSVSLETRSAEDKMR